MNIILSHWKWVNSSNCKPLDSYFKLFCLELSGKAVASNRETNMQESQQAPKSEWQRAGQKLFPALASTYLTWPQYVLQFKCLSCHKHTSCRIAWTPQRQTKSFCILALRRKHIWMHWAATGKIATGSAVPISTSSALENKTRLTQTSSVRNNKVWVFCRFLWGSARGNGLQIREENG